MPSISVCPFLIAGINPARTSEDLPLPDAPMMTDRKLRLFCARRFTNFAVSVSRPKNRSESSSSKNCKPLNGASPGVGASAAGEFGSMGGNQLAILRSTN